MGVTMQRAILRRVAMLSSTETLMPQVQYPAPPFPAQQQRSDPGHTAPMEPSPDHGEESYKESGRLAGKAAIVTGGDSGIGRALAIAFAGEGADVLIGYLDEDDDARETARWIEKAGRRAPLARGDVTDAQHCDAIVQQAVDAFGKLDVLVNNAAHQSTHASLDEITDEEWHRTVDTNIGAMSRITRAAVRHMKPGASIVNTASINADHRIPPCSSMQRPKARSRTSPEGLRNCSPKRGIRSKLRRARPDLDAVDSCDDAAGEGREVWRASADEGSRTTCRARTSLCDARFG